MPFNIEDQEAYLKNKMPYKDPDETQWKAMQERIKGNVLQTSKPKKTKPFAASRLWKTAAIAAGLTLMVCSGYLFINTERQHGHLSSPTATPEAQLNAAIAGLNETELNWVHQLTENEISEQNEYTDN